MEESAARLDHPPRRPLCRRSLRRTCLLSPQESSWQALLPLFAPNPLSSAGLYHYGLVEQREGGCVRSRSHSRRSQRCRPGEPGRGWPPDLRSRQSAQDPRASARIHPQRTLSTAHRGVVVTSPRLRECALPHPGGGCSPASGRTSFSRRAELVQAPVFRLTFQESQLTFPESYRLSYQWVGEALDAHFRPRSGRSMCGFANPNPVGNDLMPVFVSPNVDWCAMATRSSARSSM